MTHPIISGGERAGASDELRIVECPHCNGMGWYQTDQIIESGNGWDESRHWEYAEADCEVCDGTGWARS